VGGWPGKRDAPGDDGMKQVVPFQVIPFRLCVTSSAFRLLHCRESYVGPHPLKLI